MRSSLSAGCKRGGREPAAVWFGPGRAAGTGAEPIAVRRTTASGGAGTVRRITYRDDGVGPAGLHARSSR